jgi:hypothetical protein
MAFNDIEVLTACASFTLQHTHEAELQTLKELETRGATTLVNALRVFRLQRAILAVGMFSMFEALLQSKLNWTQPFIQLDDHLRKNDKAQLASAIYDYRLAVNVLKHGEGRSHQELLARADKLDSRYVRTATISTGKVISLTLASLWTPTTNLCSAAPS